MELAGLLASLNGLKSPSDDNLTSLTLLGSLLLLNTWLPVKLISASLSGEKSCDERLSRLFVLNKLSSFKKTLSSAFTNTSASTPSVSIASSAGANTVGSVFYLVSSCTVLREGVDLC